MAHRGRLRPTDLEARFWVRVVKPEEKPKEAEKQDPEPQVGLPAYVLAYEHSPEGQSNVLTWEELARMPIDMG